MMLGLAAQQCWALMSVAVGSLCQYPSLLGLALPPDPMMVGLGAQQTLVAVGPANQDPLNMGPAFRT
jgi:hypothetical protein